MGYKHPVSVLVVISARDTGRVLMLQRRDDPAFWQSVTGSLEAGESPLATACREVNEEVGIDAGSATLVDKLEYHFPDRHITLWLYLVEQWEGEPWGKEGQPGRWVHQTQLVADEFPPVNETVTSKLANA